MHTPELTTGKVFNRWITSGHRRASMALSTLNRGSHASWCSSFQWVQPWRSMSLFISSSLIDQQTYLFTSSYSFRCQQPPVHLPEQFLNCFCFIKFGILSRYRQYSSGEKTTVAAGDEGSTPAIILSKVDLPEPFRPMIPIFCTVIKR